MNLKVSLILLFFAVFFSFQQHSEAQLVLRQSVLGNGAADVTSSSNHMTGTVGQRVIGVVSDSSNVMKRGFWYIPTIFSTSGALTDVGNDVEVQPEDNITGSTSVTLNFAEVNGAGVTTLTTSDTGTPPPSGFKLGDPLTYYDLTTSAVFAGQVGVCINYSGISFSDESSLKLFHFADGNWVDVTISLDMEADIICGNVTSLSPFAIMEAVIFTYTGGPQPTESVILEATLLNSLLEGIPDVEVSFYLNNEDKGSTITGENGIATLEIGSYEAGVYEVYATAVNIVSDITSLPVYDPAGGFVTGGGWIMSPEGAYTAVPTMTGKANFGFVSKYKKDAELPSGNTQFQFKAGDLNFSSLSYDWLVVAGAKAQYKCIGTINGEGEYKFILKGIDADINDDDSFEVDRFRIKIWEEVDDEEQVVYDNTLGNEDDLATTEIGGGSIVIHNGKVSKPVAEMEALPTEFALENNYPNPFNPSKVYDLRGALVRTLVNEIGNPAFYSLVWDGTDKSGNRVSSGVYIYQLIAGKFTKTRKMLLIK